MSKYKEKVNLAGRILGVIGVAVFLIYYCTHPTLYDGTGIMQLFASWHSWAIIFAGTLLVTLCLTPNKLSDQKNRILSGCWFVLAPFAVYFTLLYLNATKFKIVFWDLNKIALGLTFLFLFLVMSFFVILTGSVRLAAVLLAIPICILGIANCFVIEFRGMALSGGDIFSIATAATVAGSYDYTIDWFIFSEAFLTFAICVISFKIRGVKLISWKQRLLVLVAWAVLAGSYFHICCHTDFLQDHDIKSEGFTHQLRYKKFDMIFTTLCTCFYLSVDKPDGYSVEKVEEIAKPYVDAHNEELAAKDASASGDATPNVIVIMNESFADYTDIGNGVELSGDNMPFIHNLTENTIKGYAYASIFGANTPNSEYEFLTGNTMGFLPPSSVGFHLFVRGNMPSLASEYKEAGYYALAMHPYRGTNYRRNIVYPQIGFQTYYARLDFKNPTYIRKYISDQSLYDKVIEEYEKNLKKDTPLFSYNVTVQNHGGYVKSSKKGVSTKLKLLTPGIDTTKVQMHSNLILQSDQAFQNLVEYFEKQEEPTVIIMFGDHQASLGDKTYEHLIGNEDDLTAEELMEKYKIPFVCWANYDIESEVIEKTSLNYLYSILAKKLNLPMTGFQNYLVDLSEEIPVLASGGYWTKDGSFYELDDKTSPYYDKVNEYHMLEYNYIFGKSNRALDFFEYRVETE